MSKMLTISFFAQQAALCTLVLNEVNPLHLLVFLAFSMLFQLFSAQQGTILDWLQLHFN